MMTKVEDALTEQFERGLQLARSGERDRASEILLECVIADPENLDFVDEFLTNLSRKFQGRGPAPNVDEDLHAAFAQAVAQRDWSAVLRLGPRKLCDNPWHLPTLLMLAEACAAEGDQEVELRYLKMAFEAAPGDGNVNRQAGRLFARLNKFDEASSCWQRVMELSPGDREATRMLAVLGAEKGGKPNGKAKVDAVVLEDLEKEPLPRQPLPTNSESESRTIVSARGPGEVKLSRIQELENAISGYPSNPEYYVEITPLYLAKGRDYDAERLLLKGRAATSDDPRVLQLWEDVTMLRMERKISVSQKHAEADRNREALAEVVVLRNERDRFETEVFVSRCLREPKNAAMRYQLGLRLKREGKLREALQCFSEALHDPAQKPAAAFEMGECLQEESEFPEALQRYRMAVESATQPQQLGCKKQALYQAACLAARIKLYRLAHRYLSELQRLDPRYQNSPALLQDIQRHLK